MRILPSGSDALLIELDDLDQVLAMYTAVCEERPAGVIDIVPAARTVLLVIDPSATDLNEVGQAVLLLRPRPGCQAAGELVEVPVTYDGEDLDEVGSLLGCDAGEVIRRHCGETWTVAFCGFAPGFGYLTGASGGWDVPRQSSPRTTVPPGSVALAGEFSGVYPRSSPGGWQLIGHTELDVFDLQRDPPALLRPGTPVRFVDVGHS
jgi:KipI family sensor histidine kinase inhibitor